MSFRLDFNFRNKNIQPGRVNDKKYVMPHTSVNSAACDLFEKSNFSLEKEKFINNSPLLSSYNSAKFKKSSEEISFNLLDTATNVNDLTDIESKCKDVVSDFSEEYKYDDMPGNMLKILVDTAHFSPDTYKHITASKDNKRCFKKFCEENKYGSGVYHCIKRLSPAALEEIKKAQKNFPGMDFLYGFSFYNLPAVNMYVSNPRHLYESPDSVLYLSKLLAQNTTGAELKVLRGERNTKSFDRTPISEELQKKVKKSCFYNQLKTRKEKIEIDFVPLENRESLYNHIKKKEKLSLSDAMIMMRYLNDETKAEVIESVSRASYTSDKFVSTTFSEEFPDKWLRYLGNTCVLNEITVPKGTQGAYLNKPNDQFEFLINNTEKEFKVTSADYDAEKDTFVIKTEMQEKE